MKYCVKCGTQIEEGALFCPNCGVKFDTLEKVPKGDMNESKDSTENNKKKKKTGLFIALGGALAAIVIIGVLILSGVIKSDQSSKLVGKWRCPTQKLLTFTMYTQYNFNQDGTYSFDLYMADSSTGKSDYSTSEAGTYKYDGKTVTLTHDGTTEEKAATINGEQLSIANEAGQEDALFTRLK